MGIFDAMASRYDNEARAQTARIIAGEIRKALQGERPACAMDYGCGTGLVGLELADCFSSLLMVDASPQMVAQVENKISQRHLSNVHTLCADFTGGAPAGLSADVVFMAQVLLHIPDTENILRQLLGVLKPGGRLLIVDFDKDAGIVSDKIHNGFVQQELIQLAERVGYRVLSCATFYRGKNLFMNRDASLFLLDMAKK